MGLRGNGTKSKILRCGFMLQGVTERTKEVREYAGKENKGSVTDAP